MFVQFKVVGRSEGVIVDKPGQKSECISRAISIALLVLSPLKQIGKQARPPPMIIFTQTDIKGQKGRLAFLIKFQSTDESSSSCSANWNEKLWGAGNFEYTNLEFKISMAEMKMELSGALKLIN